MTHSITIVCIEPQDGMTIDEQLNLALAPFDENAEDVDEDVKNEAGHVISGARWDWWSIGGRWTGYFRIKPQYANDARVFDGTPGVLTKPNTSPTHSDGAPKGMIDLEAMREKEAIAAGERWDLFQKVGADYVGLTKPWSYFLARVNDESDPYTIEQARTDYHGQPGQAAMREFREQLNVGFNDDAFEMYSVSREKMVADAIRDAVPGWAVLTTDGEYREKGWMGWWAMNDATSESRQQFGDWANRYFDSLSDDTYMIAVDVHI